MQTLKRPTPCKQCQTCSRVSEAGMHNQLTNSTQSWVIQASIAFSASLAAWLFYYWTLTLQDELRVCQIA